MAMLACRGGLRATGLAASVLGLLLAGPPARAGDTSGQELRQRYAQAIALLPSQLQSKVHGLSVQPQWSADGDSLDYDWDSAGGRQRYRVQLASGQRSVVAPTAAATSAAPATDAGMLRSPNGRWAVRAVDGNLERVDLRSGQAMALTRDGMADYAYGVPASTDLSSLGRRLAGKTPPAVGLWSPDGNRLLTYRVDERGAWKMPITSSIQPGKAHQLPQVHTVNVALPDQPHQRATLMVFDMDDGARLDLTVPPPMASFSATPSGGWAWSADGSQLFVGADSDDFRTLTAYRVDSRSGQAQAMARESSTLTLRPDIGTRFQALGNGEEVIVYSERDDRGHFYLYDGLNGRLKRQLTRGPWSVHALVRVDEAGRWLYFSAGGREAGRNPYYTHLYRVSLDGGAPQLLTPENAQHGVRFSPDGRYFVDTYSTVDTAPVHRLRRADGHEVLELGRADISALLATGWKPPVPFTVKAADGRTDLYGVMYLPARTVGDGRYPIIDAQYSAPHVVVTPRAFGLADESALAQLGFVVINVDGRATPLRTQSRQDLGFAGKQSAPLLVQDHMVAMQQLAQRHAFIDIDRAGVYGHSAGGYRAARAMLQFPDFYKVGIASAGSHDAYVHQSLARYYGRPQEFADGFGEQPNMPLAANLKGKLLIAHGEVDEDVHVGISLQLADALIRAGKDFDMFIYPNHNHRDLWDGYMTRKAWHYFVQHLRGETPPTDIQVPDPG